VCGEKNVSTRDTCTCSHRHAPPITPGEKHTFQAETKQLLNIVANSLYTDKHVFVRELVSNASDALEKLRHRQVAGDAIREPGEQLCIRITTDEAAGTLTISDSGIGMDKGELVDNLGTIARSGSKAFMAKLQTEGGVGAAGTGANIIGQFGVGFYSSFMVADNVTVFSQGAGLDAPPLCWTSTGDGSYEIAPAEGVPRGLKVVLKLKDTCRDFASASTIKDLITKYSNFVNFPIFLNDKQVNTVGAIWALPKSDVSEEQYTEFYKFKSGDFDAPLFRLHFASDAPTSIKALLFVGASHDEKYGMGRMKPGVDLYSRRVLIEASSPILPDWMRFLQGIVDSEDIPLNISRESMQDSALMKRLRSVLTRRVLRFLDSEARRDPERYATKFFPEFGQFLKEGAVTDAAYAGDIAKLLRFESSFLPPGSFTSFDEYVSRMPPGQLAIYYLVGPSRGLTEASPYMEAFRGVKGSPAPPVEGAPAVASELGAHASDVEVLFLYSPIDDFVMNNLREYNGRKLTTAETAELDADSLQGLSPEVSKEKKAAAAKAKEEEAPTAAPVVGARLTDAQVTELSAWWVAALPTRLAKVRSTGRLRSSPAVVTDHESASLRRMMRMVEASAGKDAEALKLESHVLPKQTLEVNAGHAVIVQLYAIRETSPALAKVVAEQVLDNALVAAGLVDDARTMLPRLTALLEQVLGVGAGVSGGAGSSESVTARRWMPPKEAEERDVLTMGEELYGALDTKLREEAGARAKAGNTAT